MKRLRKIYSRPLVNRRVVTGERQGYGRKLLVGHRTNFTDPEVRRTITKLSIINVIS